MENALFLIREFLLNTNQFKALIQYAMHAECQLMIRIKNLQNYKQGVNCPHCFNNVTPDQKKRFAMREFNKNKERR